jgi:hypothetical protein
MINTIKNTGSRKLYMLNKKGLKVVDNLLDRGLSNDEENLLKINKKLNKSKYNFIQKDFGTILLLFEKFGLKRNNSLFSEMIRNFVNTVEKFFRQESQFKQEIILEAKMIKREA